MSGEGDMVENETVNKAMHDEEKQKVDRLSILPNCILIYIMTFMTTKEAVQTCILSKRWINLWKYVPTLTASNTHFQMDHVFKNFVQNVLFHRDDSIPLYNVDIEHKRYLHSQLLGSVVQYAVSHGVEKLRIDVHIRGYIGKILMFHYSIFSCHSLKYLNISLLASMGTIIFPPILDLPELIECRLREVVFSSCNHDGAKPFSGCKKLSTLVIDNCTLYNSDTLCVSGDAISNLTIHFDIVTYRICKVKVSAPNLKAFGYVGQLTSYTPQLFEHNLDFLEEARIEIIGYEISSNVGKIFKGWLKRLSGVKSLTLSLGAIEALGLIPNLANTEPIRFGNLMSLIVKKLAALPVPNEVLEYLLKDSPHVDEATITDEYLLSCAVFFNACGKLLTVLDWFEAILDVFNCIAVVHFVENQFCFAVSLTEMADSRANGLCCCHRKSYQNHRCPLIGASSFSKAMRHRPQMLHAHGHRRRRLTESAAWSCVQQPETKKRQSAGAL
ncbi:hypothetical protein VNO77_33656 [Canavalia gladiata]|uniref:F-box domain-containing protein n=1 Tax=Canavalia gladiata TaxID=3824 RepID=A0AAN9PZ45_CANGL